MNAIKRKEYVRAKMNEYLESRPYSLEDSRRIQNYGMSKDFGNIKNIKVNDDKTFDVEYYFGVAKKLSVKELENYTDEKMRDKKGVQI